MLAFAAIARNLAENQHPPTPITMQRRTRAAALANNCRAIRLSRSSRRSLRSSLTCRCRSNLAGLSSRPNAGDSGTVSRGSAGAAGAGVGPTAVWARAPGRAGKALVARTAAKTAVASADPSWRDGVRNRRLLSTGGGKAARGGLWLDLSGTRFLCVIVRRGTEYCPLLKSVLRPKGTGRRHFAGCPPAGGASDRLSGRSAGETHCGRGCGFAP